MTVQELIDDLNRYYSLKQVCVLVQGKVYPIEGITYTDWSETESSVIMGVEE